MLVSGLYYPRIVAKRRMRELEKNLVPALRHLLIEVKSGVPLFNAMAGITKGYGEVSIEFKHIIKDINTGAKEVDALNDAVKRNPSFSFRRGLWQISNAITSGADIGDALQAIIDDLTKEQITAIRRYGQELNPWTMIYMVAAVIIPSLGVTFLVVISAFSGAIIPKIIYPMIAAFLLGFQLFFMNFVKSKRPSV
jgi:flagellar protein FlaJ